MAGATGARAVLLLASLAAPAAAQAPAAQTPHEMHRVHQDSAAYIAMLEDPARDAYQKPAEVVAALALRPGAVVADIGAGSGYFALRMAKEVGPTGRVYAVDVSPEMIVHLNRRLRDAGVANVQTIRCCPTPRWIASSSATPGTTSTTRRSISA